MNDQSAKTKGFSGLQVVAIVAGMMLLTVVITIFSVRAWLFPQPFTPVVLDQQEEQQLEQKLDRFESLAAVNQPQNRISKPAETEEKDFRSDGTLNPKAYSEKDASREIRLSEREINSLLAKNTDLARKMSIDLADDLISLRLLLPVDQDFPVMGGKTVRARAGAELAYRDNRPVVIFKGISLMGVPVPNAWLGGFKNIDLVREFGGDKGFWKSFSDGVETIRVKEGLLYIKLKE
jgi:hypothetical protein